MYSYLKKKYFDSLALKPLELYVNLVGRFVTYSTNSEIKAKSKPISSFSIKMRPYKIPSSFFCPQGRPFLNFSTLSIHFSTKSVRRRQLHSRSISRKNHGC
jgi:hypothetical protein